jgi:K(+)-stimulated pyrophosphate-energized sodium pump
MNILIKLMSIVALVIAPHISEKPHGAAEATIINKEVKKEVTMVNGKEVVTETITITK